MSNLRWALAPFLVLALGIGVACSGGDDDDGGSATTETQTSTQTTSGASTGSSTQSVTTSGTTTSASSTQAGATGGSGSLDLSGLATTLEDVESFRFDMGLRMDFDMPEGGTGSAEDQAAAALMMAMLGNIKAEGAYVAPDSVQLEMTLFGTNVEVIQIGAETWVNDGTGWVVDEDATSSLPFDTSSPAELPFQFLPEEQLEGAETSQEEVNGVDTTRYHFDKESLIALAEAEGEAMDVADLNEIDTMNLDVWITEEGLPVKMVLEVTGESEGSDISVNMEFNITDVNDSDISIEAPI